MGPSSHEAIVNGKPSFTLYLAKTDNIIGANIAVKEKLGDNYPREKGKKEFWEKVYKADSKDIGKLLSRKSRVPTALKQSMLNYRISTSGERFAEHPAGMLFFGILYWGLFGPVGELGAGTASESGAVTAAEATEGAVVEGTVESTTAVVKYDANFAVSQGLENGGYNFNKIRSMIPKETQNTFNPAYGGEKFIFNINNTKIQLKWHTPEFAGNAPFGSNASMFNTAQIKVGNKYLMQFGGFSRNGYSNFIHIPLK